MAPTTPATITAAAVMPGIPPLLSEMARAMAVVTLLGSRAAAMVPSTDSRWHSSRISPMLVSVPTRQPTKTGRKYSRSRCFSWQMFSASTAVAGPSIREMRLPPTA